MSSTSRSHVPRTRSRQLRSCPLRLTSPMERPRSDAFLVTANGAAGLTREQTRSRRFVTPSRGVRYSNDTPDVDASRHSAAVIGSGDGAILTDVSAARALRLPLPPWIALESDSIAISVSAPAGRNRPRRGDVRGRRLQVPPDHQADCGGVVATTPARTWLDCAEVIPVPHLVAMGDVILRRRLASRTDLTAITTWARRRRGVVSARRALPVLDERSESPGESLVRAHLVLGGIPRPECNYDIIDRGEWFARADLAWPAARVIVEYDGVVHLEERQRRSDAARRNLLQAAGWHVITLTSADLTQPWLMIAMVREALVTRGFPC